MKELLFIFLLVVTAKGHLFAQETSQTAEPVVGSPCPTFTFTKVDFYRKNTVSLRDFKGKWLILDFWSKDCSGCIGGFPRINAEQIAFKDSLEYLMIAPDDKDGKNRRLYSRFQKNLHLIMPVAYDSDSTFFTQFNVGPLPHAIIVDPNGIVRAVTQNVPAEELRLLMEGRSPAFAEAYYANEKETRNKFKYDRRMPFLIGNNGGIDSDFIFRSLLSKWKLGSPRREVPEGVIHSEAENEFDRDEGRFEAIGVDLSVLYRAAYLGKTYDEAIEGDSVLYGNFWPNPILELRDSGLFKPDYLSGQNIFSYSLVVPPTVASEEFMMKVIQDDLNHYFGFKVAIESRKMPYWRVIANDKARVELKSKGGKRIWQGDSNWNIIIGNIPIKELVRCIAYYSGLTAGGVPVLDETGITGNIDFTFDCLLHDLDCIKSMLKRNGLDLVKGEKEMKVLVIRDSERSEYSGK